MSKKIHALGLFLMLITLNTFSQSLNIATYNLRFDNRSDSLDLWENRYPMITDIVQFYDFDIFGTQEGLLNQLTDLKTKLPGYNYIGVAREDGKTLGEHSSVFYKTSKFKLLDKGDFWLSEKTDIPNKGWDAACVRICSWGKFAETATGFTFYFFNVHFDHKGLEAQKESAKLILSKIQSIAGKNPVVLTGDFNATELSECYNLLNTSANLKDAYNLAKIHLAPNGTFNGFDVKGNPEGRIDHIFISPEFIVHRYGILTNTYKGHLPSDHFPVMVNVGLKK